MLSVPHPLQKKKKGAHLHSYNRMACLVNLHVQTPRSQYDQFCLFVRHTKIVAWWLDVTKPNLLFFTWKLSWWGKDTGHALGIIREDSKGHGYWGKWRSACQTGSQDRWQRQPQVACLVTSSPPPRTQSAFHGASTLLLAIHFKLVRVSWLCALLDSSFPPFLM